MKFLYRYRGEILGVFAIALWIFPSGENSFPLSAAGLAFLGVALRVEARRVIGQHTRGRGLAAPELVTFGIYGWLRHPLYLSNLCFGLAFVRWHLGFCPSAFAFSLLLVLFEIALAKSEDAFLERRFGKAFSDWKNRTAMFFPRMKPEFRRKNFPFSKRNVRTALWSDRWTWFWLSFYTFSLVARGHLNLPFAPNF